MTLAESNYRLAFDITYTSTGNATTAESAINSALSGAGRAETCTRVGAVVTLLIVGLTEAEAVSLRSSLLTPWSSVARTGGRVSISRNSSVT